MLNRNILGSPKLTLTELPVLMENLSSKVLYESDQLKYQREMVEHHIGMLETELRAARRMLESIEEALQVEGAKVEVILAIFSGRPDPKWALSEREVKELRQLLNHGLRKPLKEPKELPGLGYSGFVIRNKGGIKGIPEHMELYRRVITIVEREGWQWKRTYYEDVNRIELWLAEQAIDRGYGYAVKHFEGPSTK